MASQSIPRAYERGVDGSRMADDDYGNKNEGVPRAAFRMIQAYQQGKPWAYADYWQVRAALAQPGRHKPTLKRLE